MRPQGVADARPLSVPEHVDKVQVSRHWGNQGAACHRWFDGGPLPPPSPMTQGLASTRQADAPLVHVQRLGAELDQVLVHELFDVSQAQQFAHLDEPRPFFLLCQQSRVPLAAGGSEPAESLLNSSVKAA